LIVGASVLHIDLRSALFEEGDVVLAAEEVGAIGRISSDGIHRRMVVGVVLRDAGDALATGALQVMVYMILLMKFLLSVPFAAQSQLPPQYQEAGPWQTA
jgi:hypothetical protein